MGEKPRRVFFKKIKRFVFNCFALQNNIEAELKFFSPFEAFQEKKKKKTLGGKTPAGLFPHKMKWDKYPAGFSPKSNYQLY